MELSEAPRALGTLTTDSLKPFDALMRERQASAERGKRRRSEDGGDTDSNGEPRKHAHEVADETWPMLHALSAQPNKLVLLLPLHASYVAPAPQQHDEVSRGSENDVYAPLASVAAPPLSQLAAPLPAVPAHVFDASGDAVTPTHVDRGQGSGVTFSPEPGVHGITADVSFFSGRPRAASTRTPARRRITSRRNVAASPGTLAFPDPGHAPVLATPIAPARVGSAVDPLSCVAAASPDFNSAMHPHLRSPEPSDLSRAALLAHHAGISHDGMMFSSTHLYMTPPTVAAASRPLPTATITATTLVASQPASSSGSSTVQAPQVIAVMQQ